jgi:hypothetical protein
MISRIIIGLFFIVDQIIEESLKCNRENDAVLLSNTLLVYLGVLKVCNPFV